MMQPTCEGCAAKQATIDAQEAQLVELAQQLAGRERQLRRAGQAEIQLQNELNKVREEEPDSPVVKRLLVLWREVHKSGNGGVKIDLASSRASAVKRAVKRYGEERVEAAIRGATLDKWAMGRDSRTNGRTYNDVAKHILKDEETIERFEGYWLNRGQGEAGGVREPRQPVTPIAPAKAEALPEYAEQKVKTYAVMLGRDFKVRDRIKTVKGWSLSTLQRLEVGWDGVARRFTFPIRDKDGRLINVVRYLPNVPEGTRKSIAMKDCPRDLFPAPESIPRCESCKGWGCLQCPDGPDVWLVEGEPDAITGWELGLPAVSVPGTGGWKPAWGERFAMPGRKVVIVPDCDAEGRASARRIAASLVAMTADVRVIDLDPSRDDKWDLGDAFKAGVTADDLRKLAAEAPVIERLSEAA